MITIYNNTKIYISSPYVKTGGPKSLHQLANVLIKHGYTVKIFYYDDGYLHKKVRLFEECKAEICDEISKEDDDKKNILIVSETFTGLLKDYRNIQKMIWWLSLDFYLNRKAEICRKTVNNISVKYKLPFFMMPALNILVKAMVGHAIPSIKRRQLRKYVHMYNCEYVHEFLVQSNVNAENMHYLCGPLEKRFYKVPEAGIREKKKSVVAFNPAKVNADFVVKITNRVAEINKEIKFVGVKGMNRTEVFETLASAKVYADFGFFPGPERMPREAAALYCNIITSNVGAASNYDDVPIPQEFKFAPMEENVREISKLIVDMCDKYDNYTKYYCQYRKKINMQIERFEADIQEIFCEKYDKF